MSVRTIWTCDGCGQEAIVSNGAGDWKRIAVTLDGFKGYPVSAERNERRTYELCPDCQQTLAVNATPTQWPRERTAAPALGEPQ